MCFTNGDDETKSIQIPVVINQTTVNQFNSIQVNAPGSKGNSMVMAPITEVSPVVSSESAASSQVRPEVPMGWPLRWPIPDITPLPFSPPGFEVSLDQLIAAVDALPPSVRDSCRKGDQSAIVQLLMGILRQVHSDPRERNVYVNPRRGDQALVYIPEHWVTCPLDDAGQAMFRRIADRLGCLPQAAPSAVKSVANAALQSCEKEVSGLAKASRVALVAHLENLRHASVVGLDWLGTGPDDEESLAFFGQERTKHLTPTILAAAVELATGLDRLSQITETNGSELATKALMECARYVVHRHSSNLTVLMSRDGQVYIHERLGWKIYDREVIAIRLLSRIAGILDDQLDGAGKTPLTNLRPWLREKLVEVANTSEAATNILENYLASAQNYYGSLRPKNDIHDRREEARRLIMNQKEVALSDQSVLSEMDLEELLGFAV